MVFSLRYKLAPNCYDTVEVIRNNYKEYVYVNKNDKKLIKSSLNVFIDITYGAVEITSLSLHTEEEIRCRVNADALACSIEERL